eukprot:2719251-Amphidinium_carterae.1
MEKGKKWEMGSLKVLIAAALAWHATALTLKADPVTAFDLSCYEEADKGAAYRGLLTNTHSGRACQNWLAAKPHNISAAGSRPFSGPQKTPQK